jgi:hypothetical protein
MIDINIYENISGEDKMNSCRWAGTPQCLHQLDMQQMINNSGVEDNLKRIASNANYCIKCNKYKMVKEK